MRRLAEWILPVAAASALAGSAAWILHGSYVAGRHTAPGSSLRSDGEGARALFLLLAETGHAPRRLTRPVPDRPGVLVTIEPFPMDARTGSLLREWVEEGGTLLLGASAGRGTALLPLHARWMKGHLPVESRFGLLLEGSDPPRWSRVLPGAVVREGTAEMPLVLEMPVGKGRLWAVADGRRLENARIAGEGNLEAALACLAGKPPGTLPVWFDEHRHGITEEEGLAYVLSRYRLVPAAAAALAFLAILAWRASPREAEPPPDAPSAEEVRDSWLSVCASLYQRSLPPPDALRLLERDFRRSLAERLDPGGSGGWELLRRRLAERKAGAAERLDGILSDLETMRGSPPPRSSRLLPLSRSMALFLKEIA